MCAGDPVLGGKIEERLAILRQAGDRLVVLGAVFVGEPVDRGLGRRACRRAVDLAAVRLHVDLDRESDFVQHVGGLVNPTALVPGAWKDLLDRLPEAERAVADGQVRRDLEPTPLDVDEELPPALRALAHPGLEADEFLLALGCRADQHLLRPAQEAFRASREKYLRLYPGVTDAPRNAGELRLKYLKLDGHFDALYTLPGWPLPENVDPEIRRKEEAGHYRSRTPVIELPAGAEKPSPAGLTRILSD